MGSNFGGAAMEKQLFDKIREILPDGKTILELGSGTGTIELLRHYRMYSVEHDKRWLGKADTSYIYAPFAGRWYDRQYLKAGLSGVKYDLFLVDGPPTFFPGIHKSWANRDKTLRLGLLKHLDLFDLSVPIILDDVERAAEGVLLAELAMHVGRPYTTHKGEKKTFGVIL
jgi:hypothetical protein